MKTTDNTTPETEFPVRMSINLANYYYQCEAQRDAALAALRKIERELQEGSPIMRDKRTTMLDVAQAAIAAAEKGQ